MLCSVASNDDECSCRLFARGVTSKVLEVVDNRVCNRSRNRCQQLGTGSDRFHRENCLSHACTVMTEHCMHEGVQRLSGREREGHTGTGIPGMATLLCTRRFCSMDARRGAESIVCWRSLGIASNRVPSRRLSCAAVSASPAPCACVPVKTLERCLACITD